MNMLETIRVALSSLRGNLLRTVLTMLGIIIGIGAVIAIMAIGRGTTASITKEINGLGSNLLMIYPYIPYDEDNWMTMAQPKDFTLEDVKAMKKLPSVADVAPSAMSSAKVTWNRQVLNAQIEGTSGAFYRVKKQSLAYGRTFTSIEEDNRVNVAILGSDAAQTLFGQSSAKTIGETIQIKDIPFKVVGIMSPADAMRSYTNKQIYIPITTGMNMFGQMDIQEMNASAVTFDKIDQARAEIQQLLRSSHKLKPADQDDFQIMTQSEIMQMSTGVNDTMNLLLLGVAIISLIIGGVGIMNIMLVSVTERTREIGIRKAIGAQRSNILTQFLTESVFISLIGGIIGIFVGIGGAKLLEKFASMPIEFSYEPIIYSFTSSVLVGIIFGVYPALKASKLKPIDALRYE
ncbi:MULTISPECIES: ABC transporter permease [Paenibacillus]|uniref:ABC transporter permease n=1 Tax=Paenibacillus TaxID=44249 RepID=UPI002430E9CF|nr:ABC transporter permease [Paenibacillus macerans]MBS5909281.1 ABC transporter permease [Paenibacillus macerans]